MVTRYTGRPHRARGSGVCIDCGTRYLFTRTYKGNYCTDCHETWVAGHHPSPSSRRRPRFGAVRPSHDDTEKRPERLEEPYDGE